MHVIRLRHPWEKSRDDSGKSVRIDVPERPGDDQAFEAATVHFRRRFNRPSGLDAGARVYLRIDRWHGELVSATVNGTEVEAGENRIDAEITSLLDDHNEIVICLGGRPGQPPRLSGEVTLAIDESAP